MGPKQKFQEGEKVLCYHGPLMYEAKCLKVDAEDKQVKYFMHYAGWNKSWDEWVNEDRIMKYNDVGLQRQKELKLAHANKRRSAPSNKREVEKTDKDRDKRDKDRKEKDKKEKEKKEKEKDKEKKEREREREKKDKDKKQIGAKRDKDTRKHKATTDSSSEPPRKTRTREALPSETDDADALKEEFQFSLPNELKDVLVEDWDYVNRQNMVCTLPAVVTVQNILNDYVDFKSSSDPFERDMADELALGVREFFNTTLPTQLLYSQERAQYSAYQFKDKVPADVYGMPHLIRLLLKLGGLIPCSKLDDKSWSLISSHVEDLLGFIAKHRASISKSDYSSVSS